SDPKPLAHLFGRLLGSDRTLDPVEQRNVFCAVALTGNDVRGPMTRLTHRWQLEGGRSQPGAAARVAGGWHVGGQRHASAWGLLRQIYRTFSTAALQCSPGA